MACYDDVRSVEVKLQSFLSSELDVGECSALPPALLTPEERNHSTP